MVEARNFKCGTDIDHSKPLTKKCKIRPKGTRKGPGDFLLKFWDPSISLERVKLETSNLASL